jgi:CRP/FNR family cyclic AMP-dependent transcriptional regulator
MIPEILGYVALGFLIAAFLVKTVVWLRLLAIVSNAAVIVYGVVTPHYPLLAIGLVMLAINAFRLYEMRRMIGATSAASAGAAAPITVDWLLPYMHPLKIDKGHVLFRKAEIADAMYFIVSGKVGIAEYDVEIGPGSLFGEIGIFTLDRVRTATATASEPCSLLVVGADKVRELFFQNPEFGFFLVGVITRRLTEDLERVAAAKARKA